MRIGFRWMAMGLMAGLTAAALLTGCAKEASVEATTVQEPPAASEAAEPDIIIWSDPETTGADTGNSQDYYLPEERTEENGMIRSYLTGQMVETAKGNRRPAAVMMSNDKKARPQYGINRAGVVYEAPVEGSMNRYMALIEDYDGLERIGSVRSCRTYYTYFAREFDAVYVHYGQSTFAKPYLKNVDNINGLDAVGDLAFYRTKDKKSPHNAYTSGGRITASIEKLGYTQSYASSYKGHYLFARDGREASLTERPGVMDAGTVKTGYIMNQAYFVYDPSDGLYHRYQYGKIHQGNEGPIAVKNVIFQYCQTGRYATTDYLDINVHTTECGYFMTDGKAIPINWEKDGEFGPTRYYDTNHDEVVLNQGKTWVCIIPTRDFAKSEIIGNEDTQ